MPLEETKQKSCTLWTSTKTGKTRGRPSYSASSGLGVPIRSVDAWGRKGGGAALSRPLVAWFSKDEGQYHIYGGIYQLMIIVQQGKVAEGPLCTRELGYRMAVYFRFVNQQTINDPGNSLPKPKCVHLFQRNGRPDAPAEHTQKQCNPQLLYRVLNLFLLFPRELWTQLRVVAAFPDHPIHMHV